RLPLDLAAVFEDVRDPEREAIDDEARVGGHAVERAQKADGLLDRRPAGGPRGAVPGDPVGHLVVTGLGRREEGDREPGALGEPDRERRLPAARAAEEEDQGHQGRAGTTVTPRPSSSSTRTVAQ